MARLPDHSGGATSVSTVLLVIAGFGLLMAAGLFTLAWLGVRYDRVSDRVPGTHRPAPWRANPSRAAAMAAGTRTAETAFIWAIVGAVLSAELGFMLLHFIAAR